MSWKEIGGDELVKAGESYQTIHRLQRISGDALPSEIITALTSVPYTDIEHEIESQHGIDVTIRSITAKKIDTDLYDQTVTFECVTNAIPIIWIAVIVASIAISFVAVLIHVNLDKISEIFTIETPFGEVNTFAIVMIGIVLVAIIILMKR